jgi:hypothetical protein
MSPQFLSSLVSYFSKSLISPLNTNLDPTHHPNPTPVPTAYLRQYTTYEYFLKLQSCFLSMLIMLLENHRNVTSGGQAPENQDPL